MKITSLVLCLALSASPALAQDARPASDGPSAGAVEPAAVESLTVARFELASGVEAREPLGVAEQFAAGTRVYAFLELKNAGEPLELVVTFERDGKVRSPGVALAVPVAKRHRTYAFFSHTKKPGRYRCIVTTKDGALVAEKSFEVAADAGAQG